MLGDELSHGWYEIIRNYHDSLGEFFESCLVLGNRFVFRLTLVMLQDAPGAIFIPSRRKFAFLHALFLRRL